jgi:Carboxypeptidase regulatory-like domain
MNRTLAGWPLAALLLISCIGVWAQSDTAQLSGYVRDATSSGVPNAAVVVRNEGTGAERRTTTNDAGYYVVSALPPGFYTVTAEATGFKRYQKTQNKLDPNIASTVDVALEVGTVAETIEVTATVANVQSESATLGRLIESTQIQLMQLNGRNPIYLAALKPGVRSNSSLARFGFGLDSGGFNINGSRSQDNMITFDGAVAIRTRANGTSIGVADADTVQEVQVLTANYNSEYGRSGGGQIRIVTKSGSRDFHGDFYEYFRNSALDANTWARNRTLGRTDISGSPQAFRYNQFGYNINGPIYIPGKFNADRNKLFFLWGQEWVRRRQAETALDVVPTALMRQGNFSELLNPTNTFFNRSVAINDPTTGNPFPNNVIPQGQLSTSGLGLLRSYPDQVPGFLQGRNNYIAQRPLVTDQRKDTISIDYNAAEKHQFRFRNQRFHFTETSAFRANTDRAPQIIDRPNETYSLNYISTLSPTFINEFLASVSVDHVKIFVDTRGERYRRSLYGINYPYLFPDRKEIFDKIPTIAIDQFATIDGGPYPASSAGPIYVLSNNITNIRGNHTLKAGFLFERAGQNDFDQINVAGVPGGTNNQNGRFVFDNSRTGGATSGLAIANAALGLFSTYAEIGARSYTPYRAQMYEWFVQDSWKATPKLRVELGLRHSIIYPYHSLWRNIVVFDPTYYDPRVAAVQDPATGFIVSGDRYNGLVFPGDGFTDAAKGRVPIADTGEFNRLFRGLPKHYSKVHKFDFQPRVGLAYSVSPGMVVRGGIGRFFTRPGVSDSVFLGGNAPLQPMVSVSNGQVDNPSGGRPANFPLNITTQDPIWPNPEAWAWNISVERELPGQTTIEIGYVGRRGLNLARERDINQPRAGTLQGRPQGTNVDPLRPYKGFGPIRLTNHEASSKYNAFQVGLNRRFAKGLAFGFAYTLSKSEDDGSGPRDILANSYDASTFWGASAFDNRQTAVVNVIYELPFLRDRSNLAGKLLGGWQVTAVSQFQSGLPFTVGAADDIAGVGGRGNLNDNIAGSREIQVWNRNGDPILPSGEQKFSEGTIDQNFWFRTRNQDGSAIFTAPAAGTFTTQGNRNIVRGPGFQNWNAGLFKNFAITERQRVVFRFEAFNWLNHPNLGGTDGNGAIAAGGLDVNPRSSTFGRVTSKGGQRSLQLSLRYSF